MTKPRIPPWVERGGLATWRAAFPCSRLAAASGVARHDEAGDEVLEAGPRDAAVRRLGTSFVDVRRLVDGEVAGAPGDEARIGRLDLDGLHAPPQLGQADHPVESVGHQRVGRPGRDARTGAQRGGCELRELGRADAAEAPGTLAAGEPADLGIECLGVVEDRVLHRDPQDLSLALALHARDLVGVIEERILGQLVESGGQVHASTRSGGTDSPSALIPEHVDSAAGYGASCPLRSWCAPVKADGSPESAPVSPTGSGSREEWSVSAS